MIIFAFSTVCLVSMSIQNYYKEMIFFFFLFRHFFVLSIWAPQRRQVAHLIAVYLVSVSIQNHYTEKIWFLGIFCPFDLTIFDLSASTPAGCAPHPTKDRTLVSTRRSRLLPICLSAPRWCSCWRGWCSCWWRWLWFFLFAYLCQDDVHADEDSVHADEDGYGSSYLFICAKMMFILMRMVI